MSVYAAQSINRVFIAVHIEHVHLHISRSQSLSLCDTAVIPASVNTFVSMLDSADQRMFSVIIIVILIILLLYDSRPLDCIDSTLMKPNEESSCMYPESTVNDVEDLVVSSVCEDGVNGVYYMKKDGSDEVCSIFKPQLEEAYCPLNKKGKVGKLGEPSPVKSGVSTGESCIKEAAAYLLDHENFAGVPRTCLTKCAISPEDPAAWGSLQQFLNNVGCSEDYSSTLYSVRDVHAIGLLDSRLFNLDRHGGNLLVSKIDNHMKLVPIDHGFILPSVKFLSDACFEWCSWKQAAVPFTDEEKLLVQNIDVEKDSKILQHLGITNESIWTYVFATTFVKLAVQASMTLKDVGYAMQRSIFQADQPSAFERIVFNTMYGQTNLYEKYPCDVGSYGKILENFRSNFQSEFKLS